MLKPEYHSRTFFIVPLLVSWLASTTCLAEFNGEFFVFPDGEAVFRNGLDEVEHVAGGHHDPFEDEHYEANIDLFLTFDVGNFRFLGEYRLGTEDAHMERLQFGWKFNDRLFWLGRFHNPVGYWNTRYHHGAYLQTSISRPAIAAYEEHGGVLPMHQAGLLAEGMFPSSSQGLGYSFAIATGPEYDGELVPWDPLDPSEGDRDASLTANLFQERLSGRSGMFANYNKIPSSVHDIDEIEQWVLGGYFDHEFDAWQFHAALYYVSNRLSGHGYNIRDSFFNSYVQVEYRINSDFQLYGRAEGSLGADGDAYLALFPQFVESRLLGGLRYDFAGRHALKLELSANKRQFDNYSQLAVQWSAAF